MSTVSYLPKDKVGRLGLGRKLLSSSFKDVGIFSYYTTWGSWTRRRYQLASLL
jgi:hypothetical protein